MIRLNQTAAQSLTLVTAQNGAQVSVAFSTDSATDYDGDSQLTSITSATTTTICSTPAASTKIDIDHISIKNTFAGDHLMTLNTVSSAVSYPLHTFTLSNGDTFEYVHGLGYKVIDSAGAVKSTGVFSSTTPLMNGVAAVGTEVAASRGDHVHPSDTAKMDISAYDTDADGIVDGAEALPYLVRNNTGVAMTKGQVVYISGAIGQVSTVALAKADTEATSAGTIGVLQEDIANNANGRVVLSGRLENFNTSAFTDGDPVYLSPTVAGAMTATKPSAPDNLVIIGSVAYAHVTDGKLLITIDNGFEIEELHNVAISAVADNDFLQYNSATGLWENTGTPALGTPASGDLRNCSMAVAPVIGSTTPAAGSFTTLNSTGGLAVGTTVPANVGIANGGGALTLTGTNQFGEILNVVYDSSVVSAYGLYVSSKIDTAAATINIGVNAVGATLINGATVVTSVGFRASSTVAVGSTANYGFQSLLTSGSGKWNFYASGTADNAFAGNTRFGGTTAPTVACDVTGAIAATTTVKTGGYTVATLPAGAAGTRAYVTDATAPTWLAALTGGGAVVCPVFHDGTSWISA